MGRDGQVMKRCAFGRREIALTGGADIPLDPVPLAKALDCGMPTVGAIEEPSPVGQEDFQGLREAAQAGLFLPQPDSDVDIVLAEMAERRRKPGRQGEGRQGRWFLPDFHQLAQCLDAQAAFLVHAQEHGWANGKLAMANLAEDRQRRAEGTRQHGVVLQFQPVEQGI